ncbi:MAG: T9SS type A sorting domain-containing protein [Bacteroidota bacterium]
MNRLFSLLFLLAMSASLSAQFYLNASDQLPDEGAKQQSMDVRAADLDQDGDLDIVLANEFQANTILFNDGSGNFTVAAANVLPARVQDSEEVAIADFNGDGWLDLVFCSEDDINLGEQNVHEYYLGSEEGSFSTGPDNLIDSEANAVISTDVNADGWPDLIFGNNGPTTLLLNDQTGNFVLNEDRIPAVNRTTQDLLYIDLTGDGHADLIEGNENGNRYFINDGNGFFTDETAERLPNLSNLETRKIVAGDVDGDNDLDLFLCNVAFLPGRNPRNQLWLNDGSGNFTDATLAQLPLDVDLTLDAVIIDLDADNDLDIFVTNIAGVPQKVYLNDGAGVFAFATSGIFEENYIREGLGLFTADFNGDDLSDIYLCDRKIPTTNFKDLLLLRAPITSSEEQLVVEQLTVFPNPLQDTFYIKGNSNEVISTALLTDSGGRTLAALKLVQQTDNTYQALWSPHLSSGIYFLKVANTTVKLIKQ